MATLAEGRSFQASCFSLFEKRRQFFQKVLVTEVPKTELLKRFYITGFKITVFEWNIYHYTEKKKLDNRLFL